MTLALDLMRELWEFSPMSASQIGARFRTTKNSVIGQAHRGGWVKRGERHPKASAQAKEAILPARRDKFDRDYSDGDLAFFASYRADREPHRPSGCTGGSRCWVTCGPPSYRTHSAGGLCTECGCTVK